MISRKISAPIVLAIAAVFQVVGESMISSEPLVYGFTSKISSQILGEERTIHIRLPKAYDEETREYPLVVVLDGSEDVFLRAVASVEYLADMQEGFPDHIVVGIPPKDRFQEMHILNQPGRFKEFIEKELLPMLAENYRCNGKRILYGQSFGSVFAAYCVMKKPSSFQSCILNSWGLSAQEIECYRSLLKEKVATSASDAPPIRMYVTSNVDDPYDLRGERRQLAKAFIDELRSDYPNLFQIEYRLYDFRAHAPFQGLHDGLAWLCQPQE